MRGENGDGEDESEISGKVESRDYLVSCKLMVKLEENLKVMVGCFVKVCRRRSEIQCR